MDELFERLRTAHPLPEMFDTVGKRFLKTTGETVQRQVLLTAASHAIASAGVEGNVRANVSMVSPGEGSWGAVLYYHSIIVVL